MPHPVSRIVTTTDSRESVVVLSSIVPHPLGRASRAFSMNLSSIVRSWAGSPGIKEIAPGVTRAAVLRDPTLGSGVGQYAIIQALASPLGVELRPVDVRDPGEIERAIVEFARVPNGGLIIVAAPSAVVHRNLIITLAARHQLPAVYSFPFFAADGGLMSYGVDLADLYRRAADYVDRILKGTKPADLPVQQPIKFNLVINLKTAKALGITFAPSLLISADEVIE